MFHNLVSKIYLVQLNLILLQFLHFTPVYYAILTLKTSGFLWSLSAFYSHTYQERIAIFPPFLVVHHKWRELLLGLFQERWRRKSCNNTLLMSWHLWGWGLLPADPRVLHPAHLLAMFLPRRGKKDRVLWFIIFLLTCRAF